MVCYASFVKFLVRVLFNSEGQTDILGGNMELLPFHGAKNSKKSALRQHVEKVQNPKRSALLPENIFFPFFMANLSNKNEILAINSVKYAKNFAIFVIKRSHLPYFNSERPKSGYQNRSKFAIAKTWKMVSIFPRSTKTHSSATSETGVQRRQTCLYFPKRLCDRKHP